MDSLITESHVVINITVDARDTYPLAPPCSPCSCKEQDEDNVEEQDAQEDEAEDGAFVVKIETCPICQEEETLSPTDTSSPNVVLECGHVFHEDCFKTFITYELRTGKTSILCPFCRALIIKIEAQNNTNISQQHVLRYQRNHIQEQILQQVNDSLTFRQNVQNFFQSRTGRYVTSTVFELAIAVVIIVVVYKSTCSRYSMC